MQPPYGLPHTELRQKQNEKATFTGCSAQRLAFVGIQNVRIAPQKIQRIPNELSAQNYLLGKTFLRVFLPTKKVTPCYYRAVRGTTNTTKVEGGQDKGLRVSGKLPEARCRFVVPGARGGGNNVNANATTTAATVGGGGDNKGASAAANAGTGSSVLDFGRASVGVEVARTVTLQNTGKSPAVFFVDTADLKLVS